MDRSTERGPLTGRAAVITGANQGLGLAIAKAYAAAGADLAICARDAGRLAAAAEEVRAMRLRSDQRVVAVPTDIADPEAVGRFVAAAVEGLGQVHILVNNAGIYGPKGRIEDVDWQEWKAAIDTNINGSVLMCRALLPLFRAKRYGKVIQISGGGATNPMPRLESYATTKAAIVRFAESLAMDCRDDHIDVNAVAPGLLDTRLLDEVLAAGPDKVGRAFYDRMRKAKESGTATPLDKGASLCVFLASAASDGITGRLISAQWDPWPDLPERRSALADSDVYTLRRIVPKDRGLDWGEPR